jgi:hypothetical protein
MRRIHYRTTWRAVWRSVLLLISSLVVRLVSRRVFPSVFRSIFRGNNVAETATESSRWDPMMLPDDYIRKMKQDLAEVEAQVESKTRYEPDPDFSPAPPDDDQPT